MMQAASRLVSKHGTHGACWSEPTAECLQAVWNVLDLAESHIADVCHQVGNLKSQCQQTAVSTVPERQGKQPLTSPLLSLICLSTLWSPRISFTKQCEPPEAEKFRLFPGSSYLSGGHLERCDECRSPAIRVRHEHRHCCRFHVYVPVRGLARRA